MPQRRPTDSREVTSEFQTIVKETPMRRMPSQITSCVAAVHAYIGMTGQGKVAVVDLGTLEVVSKLETAEGPDGLAWVGGP